jgi:methylmalonyl-CoA/ethylmalonyl-CoA epimerase
LSSPVSAPRLHHVGYVVSDLDAAAKSYAALGFRAGERHEIAEQKIVAMTFQSGSGWLELIQPTDPEGPIARYMAKRGEGTHHVAFEVDDITAELERLKAAGVRLIDETPRRGAHNWRIAFIHPESCNGVLTELVQVN